MDISALAASISPPSSASSSKCSISRVSLAASTSTSWSTSASSASSARLSKLRASSTWPLNFCQRSMAVCSGARRFNTSWASSISSQKFSRAIWASRATISACALTRSKMTSEHLKLELQLDQLLAHFITGHRHFPLLFQKGCGKLSGVERPQVVHAFPNTNVTNRYMELLSNINDNATLRRPVELGQHQAGQTETVVELLHLCNAILTCSSIEN